MTSLNRRYFGAMGVVTVATLAVVVPLLLFVGVGHDIWDLLSIVYLILVPFSLVVRALWDAPPESPPESK